MYQDDVPWMVFLGRGESRRVSCGTTVPNAGQREGRRPEERDGPACRAAAEQQSSRASSMQMSSHEQGERKEGGKAEFPATFRSAIAIAIAYCIS